MFHYKGGKDREVPNAPALLTLNLLKETVYTGEYSQNMSIFIDPEMSHLMKKNSVTAMRKWYDQR